MKNSAKNGDSISNVATEVDANSSAPLTNTVRETVRVEPSIARRPIKDAQLEGTLPTENKNPAALEIGGTDGPEPTRYGDWEHKGRCYDF
jgi:hypothetical protein